MGIVKNGRPNFAEKVGRQTNRYHDFGGARKARAERKSAPRRVAFDGLGFFALISKIR